MANAEPNNVDVLNARLDRCRAEYESLHTSNLTLETLANQGAAAVPPMAAAQIAVLRARIVEQEERMDDLAVLQRRLLRDQQAVLALRDACSLTLDVPADVDNAANPMPANQPNYNEILKICRSMSTEPIDFLSTFTKLFRYGERNNFSHDTYKEIIAMILVGNHHREFTKIQAAPLQEICNHFLLRYGTLDMPQHAMSRLAKFRRGHDENLFACMERYDSLLRQAEHLIPPAARSANRDQLLTEKLFAVLGEKTRMGLQEFQQDAASRYHFKTYNELLQWAFNREEINGERGPGSTAAQLLDQQFKTLGLHHVNVATDNDRDDPELNAIESRMPKTPQKRKPNIHVQPAYNYTGRETRNLFGSRERSASREATSADRSQETHGKQLAIDYNGPETTRAYNAQGTRIQIDPRPRNFQQPGTIPAYMDYNQSRRFQSRDRDDQRSQSPFYQRNGRNTDYRYPRNDRYRDGPERRVTFRPLFIEDGDRRDNSRGNWQGDWRGFENAQNRRNRSNSRERTFDSNGFQGRNTDRSRDFNRGRSPNGRNRERSQSYDQYDGRERFRPRSRTRSAERGYEPVPGINVRPNFDNTKDQDCVKCGGRETAAGVQLSTLHADDNCHLYRLWNPEICFVCKQNGVVSHHFERFCKRTPLRISGNGH
jgi:hypothetical protein